MTDLTKLVSGEASTLERDFTIPTLNGYKIFYGETAREIWGKTYEEGADQYSDEGIEAFRAWREKHNVAYWAAPREEFFSWEGAAYAKEVGADYLILEDLS